MQLPRLCLVGLCLVSIEAGAGPALLFQMDQTPVTGSLKITNAVTTNTAYWGTLTGSGAIPTLTNGATANTGSAWQFNPSYYLAVGPNNVTRSLCDITNTTGLSVAFWIKYNTASNFVRVCGLGNSGETFDFSTQSGRKILWRVGYQSGPNAGWVDMAPTNVVFDGNWHHVVGAVDFRRNATNAVVYIDGVPALTDSSTFYYSVTNTGTLNVGARGSGTVATNAQIDQFIVYTNALQAAEVSQLYSLGTVTNYAPVVVGSATETALAWTNGATSVSTTMSAFMTDDGLPSPPGRITNLWMQASSSTNASATFATPTNASTTVTFTNTGTYVLRCVAGDGLLSDRDEVTIRVFPNTAPVVAAWSSPAAMLSTNPTVVTLSGWVLDDGQPASPGYTTSLWTRVSSPGSVSVTFANPTNVNTTVTIPTNLGSYVLRLTASDSLFAGSADVTITVTNNFAPVVTAWAAQPILQWPSNRISLQASVVDDGLPSPPGALTSLWSVVSGPGSVTFDDPTALNTSAAFSLPGSYELRFVASDGQLRVTNRVWANLWSNSVGVDPPLGVRPMSSTPPPYEHPRIFFTDADRADLQARAAADPVVQAALFGPGGLSNIVATTVDNPASPVGAAFVQLSAGDSSLDIANLITNGVDAPNTFLTGTGGLYEPLASACYLAWLWPTNTQRLQQLATAVASAAASHNTWYYQGVGGGNILDLSHDVHAGLGVCYDLVYDWMSESQRAVTRGLLARMTTNRHTYGWNEEDYANSTNWRTHHHHLVLAQLAIEGETGYDAVATATNMAGLKTFCTRWGITEGGFSREGTGYFSFGMRNAILAATAWARRGENLFVTSRLYPALQESFYMMAPGGVVQNGHHDGSNWGNDTTGIGIYYRLMQYMYTNDLLADCVLRNYLASSLSNNPPLATAIFGGALLTGNTNFTITAAARNLGLTKFDAQRGLGVVRSDWGSNALQLDFDCRFDTMTLGHLHSDRNNFTLWSHGRTWIGDPGYHVTENGAHSTVFIDDIGQAGCASNFHWPSLPGHFLEYRVQSVTTLFAGDAAAAYGYFWDWDTLGSGTGYRPTTSYSGAGKGVTTPWRWADLMYAPPVDLTGANAWMTNYVRASNVFNPVLRACRTAVFQGGTNAYVILVDDIQKDANPHTYQWSANTVGSDPNSAFADPVRDVAFVSTPTATEAVFYHTNDSAGYQPRLLVRVLEAKGAAGPIELVDYTNTEDPAHVAQLRRIAITRSNVVAPDFKMLLFPHLAGTALPTTSWSNNVLTVQMADGQTDRIYFQTNSDGRTRVQTFRIAGQGALAPVPVGLAASAGVAQVTLNWDASAGATGYNVKGSTNSGGPYTLLAPNVTGTSYLHTGLSPDITNYYVVSALNPNGESEDSGPVEAVPFATAPPSPGFSGISLSGANLIITGTNGTDGQPYYVLTSTNLALPLTNWTLLATNQFGPSGNFSFTNSITNSPQTFYRLRL